MSFFLFANSSKIVLGCFTDALTTGAVSTIIFFALLSFGFVVVVFIFIADGSMPFALSLCCLLFSANFISSKSFCFCANIFTASFASIFTSFPPLSALNSFSNSSLWCLSMCIFNRSLCLNGSRSQYGHCKSIFFNSDQFASALLLIPPVATMPFFFFISSFLGPPILFLRLLLFKTYLSSYYCCAMMPFFVSWWCDDIKREILIMWTRFY